ncbi:response regulator [Dactylococcopsis salina]|uniref:Response regulator containing a CheY-like receiver domain and an HTH DNA-binding domain n=1 Tax=Dactylococcopsis salina (strain PCC 8305) TaxID=13035 RepID=K9YWY4_DACS8|nr:response regulator [Dactylococcopsis salina]AFZ51424.1 response regulator containing a CheY-like receiver domain and an HTH DNA-binding domain [Dactylococcopsis salina PCC 8305]
MSKKQLNILLVEDDEVDRMTVKRAFKKNNLLQDHQLFIARDGLEALSLLKGESAEKLPFHNRLVLLDLNMPKMGGIEFLQALRKDTSLKATSVIILTTSDEDRDKVEAYKFNVAGYILKPVTFDKFVETIAVIDDYWQICQLPTIYPDP